MFACNRTSPMIFFDALATLQNLQQQQYEEHLRAQKPKIVKKVETEDAYQIQIFKQNGDFNSYELKVLRTYGNPKLVNLVVESRADDFRKIFQFSVDDIDIQSIDWEHFKQENVLVLNIPKKVKFCSDDFANSFISSLLGVPPQGRTKSHKEHKEQRKIEKAKKAEHKEAKRAEREQRKLAEAAKEAEKEARRAALQLEAERALQERQAAIKREAERQAAIKKEAERQAMIQREVERQLQLKREAERRAIEVENQRRAAAEAEKQRRASIEAEKERRTAAVRARKTEEDHRRKVLESQQYLANLFGNAFVPHFEAVFYPQPEAAPEASPQSETPQTKALAEASPQKESSEVADPEVSVPEPEVSEPETPEDEDSVMSDTDSIHSEVHVPSSPSSPSSELKKQPSIEEVEDEEFVVLRKKFGN